MNVRLVELLSRLELCKSLGHGQWIARCPVHADHSPSLSVAEGDGGRVLLHCFAGCSFAAVRAALGGLPRSVEPSAVEDRRSPHSAVDRSELARRLWAESEIATGSPVHSYLENRGILMDPVPPSLRFHPRLRHPSGFQGPAMVAGVQGPDGRIVGVHRTWLGPGGVGKADLDPSRAMLGPCAGGAVRFAKPSERLALAEGIETALSVALACPELAVWAALSTVGLTKINLPGVVRSVILCADADAPGLVAARVAAARLIAQGRTVQIAVPPSGGADFNDLLQESPTASGCAP